MQSKFYSYSIFYNRQKSLHGCCYSIHWIPPEFHNNFEFVKKSTVADVWAFATTLWEIFSLGSEISDVSFGECKQVSDICNNFECKCF